MKKMLILSCFLFSILFVSAQIPYPKTASGHLELGPSIYNLDSLNSILTRPDSGFGFSPFRNPIFSMGFGMDYNVSRWMFGTSIYAYVYSAPGQTVNRVQPTALNYYYGTVKLGYVVYYDYLDGKPFLLYPSVGVGGGFSRLSISSNGSHNITTHTTSGRFYDFSFNMHWFPPIMTTDDVCVKLGASIGYIHAPGKGWDLSEFNEGNRLDVSPQGFYLRLIFGMAGGEDAGGE